MVLRIQELHSIQSKYGVLTGDFYISEVTFKDYIAQCRVYTGSNLPDEYSNGVWDEKKKLEFLLQLTRQFVEAHKVRVKGYTAPDGSVDTELLEQDVIDSITGVSVLREALEDPDVDEIQINDKDTLFVSKGGRLQPYVDKHGRVMQFSTDEEVTIMLNRLLDDGTSSLPQLTQGYPMLNAKTAKDQYRVNAVHNSANSRDKPPNSFPITNVTLRKFKEVKLKIEDLVKYGACTEQMGRLLLLLGRAQLSLFCVGPTGSGKTTLLNIIAHEIPRELRIILIQNPTEILLVDRDEYGRNRFNVVHHEVSLHATMEDLITNSLRETPDILIGGEGRSATEFQQILRAMQTGQKFMGTYHAHDADDGLGRFASELSSLGGTNTEYYRVAADKIDVIVAQYRFPDGTRRIMEISVIEGVDKNGKARITKLFEFKVTGKVYKNEFGLDAVEGEFVQSGYLSPEMQRKFFLSAISAEEIAEFVDTASTVQKGA